MENKNDKLETIEAIDHYRVGELEKNFALMQKDLSEIKTMITSWNVRLSNPLYLNCPIHIATMETHNKRLEAVEEDINQIKPFMYKCMGFLAAVQIVVTLFVGPFVNDYLHPAKPAIVQFDHNPVVNTNSTIQFQVGNK